MPQNRANGDVELPLEVTRQIDALCDECESALKARADVRLEGYVARIDRRWRRPLLDELIVLALEELQQSGAPDPQRRILEANPTVREELVDALAEAEAVATVTTDLRQPPGDEACSLAIRCPHCHSKIEFVVDASSMETTCGNCGGSFSLVDDAHDTRDAVAITRIAHFELIERLGMGEFGTVWKARDTMLDRTVALKIPRREQLDPLSVEKFMREARAAGLASLGNSGPGIHRLPCGPAG